MSNKEITFCHCDNCPHEQVCCSSDAWIISLTFDEIKKFPHSKQPNGQFVIASGADGYCIYRDSQTGKCRTYDNRPMVCKKFSCKDRDEEMKNLLKKHKEIRKNLDSSHSAFFVAFIFPTSKQTMASSLMVKDIESGKEIQLIPNQVFGNSEDEVKEKIKELIEKPFRKENL